MSNLHLVTGHAGKTHVTSADHGSMYAALYGSSTYLLDKGSKFAASIISDNLVRIADGDLLMQGRHARIPDNEYVELVIPTGTQGYKRSDLIVARYTKDADTGIEEIDLQVLIGEPIAASPADPAYITGDIIKGGALTNDVPLYRVNLDGITITGIDSLLPAVIPVLPERIEDVRTELLHEIANAGGMKSQLGTYTGTGGTSVTLNFTFNPIVVFVVQNTKASNNLYACSSKILIKGAAVTSSTVLDAEDNVTLSWGTNKVTFTGTKAQYASNLASTSYRWLAIG